MKKITGWGIPFLGCISHSSGLWAVIFLGGSQAIQAINSHQENQMVRATGTAAVAVVASHRCGQQTRRS